MSGVCPPAQSPRASAQSRNPHDAGSRTELSITLGITVVLWIWLTRNIWEPGLPIGADVAAHVVRADELVQWYLPNGQLDGWQDRFGTGYQASLFLGPGFSLLVALVRLLTLGRLDSVVAVKVVTVAVLAGQSLALAAVGRASGLSRRACGLAAVFSVLVSSSLGGAGLAGVFGVGLLPQQAATVYLLLLLAVVLEHLRRPRLLTVCAGAVLIALLLITHPVTSALACAAVVAAVASSGIARVSGRSPVPVSPTEPSFDQVRNGGRKALGGVAAIVLGVGMAGVVMVPMVAHADLRGRITFFDHKSFADGIIEAWEGSFLVPPLLAVIVLLGWLALVPRVRERDTPTVLVVLLPVIFAAQVWAARALFDMDPLAVQLPNRSWGVLALLCLLPASTSIAAASTSIAAAPISLASDMAPANESPSGSPRARTALGWAGLVMGMLMVLLAEPVGRFAPAMATPNASLVAIGELLRREVPDSGRFVVQRAPRDEWPRTGVFHPDFWLVWASGSSSLNAFNPESSLVDRLLYLGDDLSDANPESSVAALRQLRTSHVVFMEPDRFPRLLGSRHLRTVWSGDGLLVAALVAPLEGAVLTEATVAVRSVSPGHRVVTIDSPGSGPVALGITWSPKWVAYREGSRVLLHEGASHLLTVDVPAGTQSIDLRYESDGWDTLGRLTSLIAAVIVFGLLFHHLRSRRRAGEGNLVWDS